MRWCPCVCSYMAANFHEPEVSLLHRFLVARDNDIEKAKVRLLVYAKLRKALESRFRGEVKVV